MDAELIKEVKIRLRSLVVSSPTQMDSRMLMRDYFKMLGTHIPLSKMGYRDFVTFLRERCHDSFLLSGPQSNPILTVIVPDSTKHIDNFVQRSKVPSTSKVRVKRRSILESRVNPPQDSIFNSYIKCKPSVIEKPKEVEVKPPDIITINSCQNKENGNNEHHTTVTSNDVKNFLKKRFPIYNSFEEILSEKDGALSLSQDNDSGKHTSSSSNSTKALKFEELKSEIMELITAAPDGVWCTDLIKLYRERYNRELNFTRFGYTSIVSLAYALETLVQITRPEDTGDWLVTERARASPAPAALCVSRAGRATLASRAGRATLASRATRAAPAPGPRADPDSDDALPGVEFDPDVFPADCVGFMEVIPSLPLTGLWGNQSLLVKIGEVYSPSHFWFIRIGEDYSIAMDDMMDEMTEYYSGPGRDRVLARGAVRVGHYCAALYDNDWHRSVIVKILDTDTVKVRHVDYGTVETVPVQGLRALLRRWAALPAQAVRARLACVRPGAAGLRWPHAACTHFLRLVNDAHLYANVVAIDAKEQVVETLLIDTRGSTDVNVGAALVRAGHADARSGSVLALAVSEPDSDVSASASELLDAGPRRLRTWDADADADVRRPLCAALQERLRTRERVAEPTVESYLYPRFEALEGGDTPSLGEIQAYLRDGIALDYVEAYRRHVPLSLAPPPSLPHPAAPPPAEPDSDDDATLHDFYVTAPPSPPPPPPPPPRAPSPDMATRIPLLMPAPATPRPAAVGAVGAVGGLSPGAYETYCMLARVNPQAAHWYLVGASGRAAGPVPPPPGFAAHSHCVAVPLSPQTHALL